MPDFDEMVNPRMADGEYPEIQPHAYIRTVKRVGTRGYACKVCGMAMQAKVHGPNASGRAAARYFADYRKFTCDGLEIRKPQGSHVSGKSGKWQDFADPPGCYWLVRLFERAGEREVFVCEVPGRWPALKVARRAVKDYVARELPGEHVRTVPLYE